MANLNEKIKLTLEADDRLSGSLIGAQATATTVFGPGSKGIPAMATAARLAVIGSAAAMGTALSGALITAGEKAADFEFKMTTVGALIGTTVPGEMDKLNAKAREMGATTAFAAGEAALGMEALAMAGFDTNEILEAMRPLLNAATAGTTNLGLTADIVSNIMSGFNIPAAETGRIADVLTQTFTSSNTTLETLGETLKFAAPIARAAGQSLEEVAAAAGLMGDAGIKGSMSGTALRGVMLRLQAPTGRAAEKLDELNIQLRGADSAMLPLPDLVAAVQSGIEGLDPEEQTRLLKDLIGEEAMAGFQVLLAAGPEKLRAYADELRNSFGRAAEIADEKMNTTRGAAKQLQSAWESLQITVGMGLTPAFQFFANEGVTPAIRAIDSFIQKEGAWTTAIGALSALLALPTGGASLAFSIGAVTAAFDLAEDKLRELLDIKDRSQDFFKDIDRAGGNFQSTLEDLVSEIGQGEGQGGLIGALREITSKGRDAETRFEGIAGDTLHATTQTKDYTQSLEALKTKYKEFNALEERIFPSKAEFSELNLEFDATIQKVVALQEAGMTAGQELVLGMTTFFQGSEGQNILAGGLEALLGSGSLRGALSTMGGEMGAIIGGALGGPLGATLASFIGGPLLDQLGGLLEDIIPGLSAGDQPTSEGGFTAREIRRILELMEADPELGRAAAEQIVLDERRGTRGEFSDDEWTIIYDWVVNEGMDVEAAKQRMRDVKSRRDGHGGKEPDTTPKEGSDEGGEGGDPANKPIGDVSLNAAGEYLVERIPGEVSRAALQNFGLQAVRIGVTDLSAFMTLSADLKDALTAAAAGESIPNGPIGDGVVLTAAHGFSGMVHRRTGFIAGEAGPERVEITPAAQIGNGASKQIVVNFTLNTLNVDQVENQRAMTKLARWLAKALRDESELGADLMFQQGILEEVAV